MKNSNFKIGMDTATGPSFSVVTVNCGVCGRELARVDDALKRFELRTALALVCPDHGRRHLVGSRNPKPVFEHDNQQKGFQDGHDA